MRTREVRETFCGEGKDKRGMVRNLEEVRRQSIKNRKINDQENDWKEILLKENWSNYSFDEFFNIVKQNLLNHKDNVRKIAVPKQRKTIERKKENNFQKTKRRLKFEPKESEPLILEHEPINEETLSSTLYLPDDATFMLFEETYGEEITRKLINYIPAIVNFQLFWRTFHKYNHSEKITEIRRQFKETQMEIENAYSQGFDAKPLEKTLKFFSNEFCEYMNEQVKYVPPKPKATKKHNFLHRKEPPQFLKKKKTPEKSPCTIENENHLSISPTTLVNQEEQSTTLNNEEVITDNNNNEQYSEKYDDFQDEVIIHTPKPNNDLRRSLSNRIFKLAKLDTEVIPPTMNPLDDENVSNQEDKSQEIEAVNSVIEESSGITPQSSNSTQNLTTDPQFSEEHYTPNVHAPSPQITSPRSTTKNVPTLILPTVTERQTNLTPPPLSPIRRRAPPPPQTEIPLIRKEIDEMYESESGDDSPKVSEDIKRKAEELYNSPSKLQQIIKAQQIQSPVKVNSPKRSISKVSTPPSDKKPNLNSSQLSNRSIAELNESIKSWASSSSNSLKPPTRKPPEPQLTLEELLEIDRKAFREIELRAFPSRDKTIVAHFSKDFVWQMLQ
ncbi:hypothetical protein ABK040_006824 [Willaertia magna]